MNSQSCSDRICAAFVFLFTLTFYLMTIAPTVTFWDAGEFIATSHILGIPHPPGTPLFVLLGRVWSLLTFFSVAFQMNLFSAICGSLSTMFLYLILARILRETTAGEKDRFTPLMVHGGALSGAIISSFMITVWDNTTETEVYVLVLITISLFSWLTLRWRDTLAQDKRTNAFVLISFLSGLSVGNHLMALLVIPSVILFVVMLDWRTLVNLKTLLAIVAFFLLGLSVHLYLPIRASLDPSINEADPSTWEAFKEVLTRKQYGSRSIFERSADLFRYQIPLYFIYFSDQFGRIGLAWPFGAVGLWGMWEHYRRERKSFFYFLLLFLITSLGLVIYLNFKVGHTQALDEVPNPLLHEVRERDYFFIVSFVVFGLWIGLGLASLFRFLMRSLATRIRENRVYTYGLALVVFSPSLLPLILNYHRADRSGDFIAYDYAYNILQSVEPYGLIFTNGDNDTFPLWFLQEVIGLRKDVTVANLSLLNTPWYIKQIRDRVFPRPDELSPETRSFFQREGFDMTDLDLTSPFVSWSDKMIDALYPQRIPWSLRFVAGDLSHEYPKGTIFFVKDLMVLHILEANAWRRPVYFAVTVSDDNKVDLFSHLVMEGLVYRIEEIPADSIVNIRREIAYIPETKTYINTERTAHLLNDVYQYRSVFDEAVYKSPNTLKLLNNYAAAYSYLGRTMLGGKELSSAIECYEKAYRFASEGDRFLYLLGSLYAQDGQGDKADVYFRRFLESGEGDPQYLFQMASFLLRGGDTIRGVEYLEEVTGVNPDHEGAYRLLDRIYRQKGEAGKAEELRHRRGVREPGGTPQ